VSFHGAARLVADDSRPLEPTPEVSHPLLASAQEGNVDLIPYVIFAVAIAAVGGVAIFLARLSTKITSSIAKSLDDRIDKKRRDGLTSDFDMK
jgi:hypothetical protein